MIEPPDETSTTEKVTANLPALERFVGEASDVQNKLILLVGRCGKTQFLQALARRLNVASFNIGAKLGHRLAATPVSDRGFLANELLRDITKGMCNGTPLLLDNLEMLFEPSLNINPLNIMKLLARSRMVIATWPGEIRNDRLIYADIGHPEYHEYTCDGIIVFETTQSLQGAGRSKA